MVFLEQVRNFHDDIVFRHLPEIRELAPLVLSGVFLLGLATMLATTLLGDSGTHWRSDPSARIEFQRESRAVHSATETIEVRGLPIDIGDWPRN